MELKQAMNEIRKDPSKGKAFLNDPAGTLKSMGVDTSKHRIEHTKPVSEGATHGGCASVGCGVCASVG